MAYRLGFPNFSKGEIAPDLAGRFDVDAYGAAARKARNCVVLKYGGLEKRPGTRFVAEVLDPDYPVRLIPFQFSIEQAYALELGQGYMRVAAMGGLVVNQQLFISAIANEAQARITAAYHGYSVGQEVYLSGINGALGDHLNGRIAKVTSVVDAHNFKISIDARDMPAFTGASGGIVRITEPVPVPADPPVPPPVSPPPPPPTGGGGDGRDPDNPNVKVP